MADVAMVFGVVTLALVDVLLALVIWRVLGAAGPGAVARRAERQAVEATRSARERAQAGTVEP